MAAERGDNRGGRRAEGGLQGTVKRPPCLMFSWREWGIFDHGWINGDEEGYAKRRMGEKGWEREASHVWGACTRDNGVWEKRMGASPMSDEV